MHFFKEVYVLFNQCECLIWWAFGACFVIIAVQKQPRGALLLAETSLVVGFIFFGLSDYVESNDQSGPPLWLWLWKLSNGLLLFALLIWREYILRGPVALNPWRFIAAGFILALALYHIFRD